MTDARLERCYCYAVGRDDIHLPDDLTGVMDVSLEKHNLGSLSVIVSGIDVPQLRPQRKILSAHYRVLSALSTQHDILPMAFGIIFDDRETCLATLGGYDEMLREQIAAVTGSVEVGIRLKWEGVDVFTVVVESHADLQAMRDRCFSGGNPSQRELLDLGQAFEQRLNQDRDKRLELVLATVRPLCRDIRVLPTSNENTSVNIACLVRRTFLDKLDEAVEKLAEMFDDNHLLEVDGPLPPFNFVEIRI